MMTHRIEDHVYMGPTQITQSRQSGFTMLEVLIALLIIVLGLLGLAGMQVRMHQAEFESYQRTQALILLYDMVDRINFNRSTVSCFAFTTTTGGTPNVGTGSAPPTGCAASTAANNTMADTSIAEWDAALEGAAEVKGGASVGAIVGARGCVTYDAATELLDSAGAVISGTGLFTVTVAWQGTVDTVAPTAACGNNQYGAETLRRAVSTSFRIARLS
jgi:type IV pilus assembly protein PilV